MTDVIIRNMELVLIHNAAHNAQQHSNGLQGRTRMKLDDIITEITPKRESFQRHLKGEVEEHVAQDPEGEPRTITSNGRKEYIFKNKEHKQAYFDFVDLEHEMELPLLGEEELGNIITVTDKFGSSKDHFDALKLVTEGYANRPELEKKSNQESKDEEE